MEKLKVSQVAKLLGVSTQAVYKRLVMVGNTLATHCNKEKGITYLSPEGFSILKESFGNKPGMEVSPVGNSVATLENQVKEQKEIIGNQQRTIESLIFQQEESRKRTDTILMKLTTDISTLQKAIEYRKPEPPAFATEKRIRTQPQSGEVAPSIRAVVMAPTQREVSAWVSLKTSFDDLLGFAFGRG